MKIPEYITFTNNPKNTLNELLNEFKPDKVAFLVDENTKAYCLPLFELDENADLIEIKSGEINKNLDTCQHIWQSMTDLGFSRKSLLINVGGGVIGDMGGFCASTYKRGIRFFNFPTTLLAAVDANIGGKLGIDFNGFKNHIGVFQDPDAVVVCDQFLSTLPKRELRSGFAEVIKHGLIYDAKYYASLKEKTFPDFNWNEIIRKSIEIKGDVVAQDPREGGIRKILNFGHTLGHGIETWYLNSGKSLLHGEAISIGMITEGYLSEKTGLIAKSDLSDFTGYIQKIYGLFELPPLEEILPLMQQDKKNVGSEINYSLLEGIGKCGYDQKIGLELIEEAFDYYENLK